ncbi:tumor necrosis factor receptor superfamily member 9a [Thalassophryne amazonica]|uniref:tumor necrosis factor receptor superfamily member 9a n=1 Tax=Thalassophryne amazonica TaxID=390379 RepID=UPI001471956B|nr:tumor necrosis factor receptor superfamily member 9a [Thalassophryne amazonica]
MRMTGVLWMMCVSVLIHGCCCSLGLTERGCRRWTQKGNDVCCDACKTGNRLVKRCGPRPADLCKPCEQDTFTVKALTYECEGCNQCVGAQILLKACTTSTDTVCGCKEGLICGDGSCSFCVKQCGKGEEPAEGRTCRPCPDGTFNDQLHQKCKPWSTKCSNPQDRIVVKGDAFNDIKCANISEAKVINPPKRGDPEEAPIVVVIMIVMTVVLSAFITIVVILKMIQNRRKTKIPIAETPTIRTPTDDPKTLIAVECSFHEAQQEQGSSSESLNSGDSTNQLLMNGRPQ